MRCECLLVLLRVPVKRILAFLLITSGLQCDYVTRLRLDHVERVSCAQVDRSWPTTTNSRERLAIDQFAFATPICGFPQPAWERGPRKGKRGSIVRSERHLFV
jgi:hypothetical protein